MTDRCEETGTFKYNCQVYRFENGFIGVDFYERQWGSSSSRFVKVQVPAEIYKSIKNYRSDMLEYQSNEVVKTFLEWLDSINFYQLNDDDTNTEKLEDYIGYLEWKFDNIEDLVNFVKSEVIRINTIHEYKPVV
jgi:hypothetical protein